MTTPIPRTNPLIEADRKLSRVRPGAAPYRGGGRHRGIVNTLPGPMLFHSGKCLQ